MSVLYRTISHPPPCFPTSSTETTPQLETHSSTGALALSVLYQIAFSPLPYDSTTLLFQRMTLDSNFSLS